MKDTKLREILNEAQTIAVVGMSRDSKKAAYQVPAYLARIGWEIVPVNPFADKIMGRQSYSNLMQVPNIIDIVTIFRPSDAARTVVEEAIRRHETRGDVKLIWLQLGIVNRRAQELAASVGIPFVQDRCMSVEIPRLFPAGLHL